MSSPVTATSYRFDTPQPLELSVRNQSGSVEVTAADIAETTVEILPNDARGAELAERTTVALTAEARHLRIDVPDRRMLRQPPLEILVTLPTGSTVDVWTAAANVQTRGRLDTATVTTASADVSLAQVTGRATVTTASGNVYVGWSEGPMQVRTASGDVRVDASGAGAAVQTASGDVAIGRLSGKLTARSASGDIAVDTASTGAVQAKTMSGDVVIGVASGLLLWLDVLSVSGDVVSQLAPEDAGVDPDRDPDLRISATTMSGDILLRRGR